MRNLDNELKRMMMQEHLETLEDTLQKRRLLELYERMEDPRYTDGQKRALVPMINQLEKALQFPMQTPTPEALTRRYPLPDPPKPALADLNAPPSEPSPSPAPNPVFSIPPPPPPPRRGQGRSPLFADSPIVIEVEGEQYVIA